MANELPNPITRDEKYLAKAAGVDVDIPTPITREEKYLNAIAEGGGGGGFTPTETQLEAMNSGITSEDVEQITTNKNNISLIDHASGTKLFFTETEPTGDIPNNSYWVSTTATKIYIISNNLFNKATALDNKRIISTGIQDNNGTFASDYVAVNENIEMSISGLAHLTTTIFFYVSNVTNLPLSTIQTSEASTYTFTVPTGAKYMRFSGDMTAKDTAMLNVGSSVLPYEPYGGTWT